MNTHMETRGFSTLVRGADAAVWDAWARTVPRWNPTHTSLVVVAPHPDDETLGAGGLIFSCVANRIPVTVVSVTNGEAACPEVHDLAGIRRLELLGAMRELGVPEIRLIALGLRDGEVRDDENQLAEMLADLIPAEATLVGPFELDGHPDHEATGRACLVAARRCGVTFARYPIWALHRDSRELRSEARPRRFLLSTQARRAKQRALAHFQSQIRERVGGAIVPAHVLEYFLHSYELLLL
jgi:LmbE family N-acetylglucosaminyl deacetylase